MYDVKARLLGFLGPEKKPKLQVKESLKDLRIRVYFILSYAYFINQWFVQSV